MNKITTKIMAVLAIAFALASCTDVDMWDEDATPHRADVSLSVSGDFTSDSTLFVAHRLFVTGDSAIATAGTSAKFDNLATGDYKFYAISLDRSVYGYGGSVDSLLTFSVVSDSTGTTKTPLAKSIYKDNILVSFKPYAWDSSTWNKVKTNLDLTGDFISPVAPAVYCDSTMKTTIKPQVAESITLENHSSLTTKFTVSFDIESQKDITKYSVYCVLPNIGGSVDIHKNVDYTTTYKALLKMSPAKKDNTYTYTGTVNAFGITPGTMIIYVCSGSKVVNEGKASYTVNLRDSKIKVSGTVLTIK